MYLFFCRLESGFFFRWVISLETRRIIGVSGIYIYIHIYIFIYGMYLCIYRRIFVNSLSNYYFLLFYLSSSSLRFSAPSARYPSPYFLIFSAKSLWRRWEKAPPRELQFHERSLEVAATGYARSVTSRYHFLRYDSRGKLSGVLGGGLFTLRTFKYGDLLCASLPSISSVHFCFIHFSAR